MDLDYCKNIECAEYAVKNTIFCQKCLNYISISINPFLKGWISRNETKHKMKLDILSKSLSPFITGYITRKTIKNKFLKFISLTPDKGIKKQIYFDSLTIQFRIR